MTNSMTTRRMAEEEEEEEEEMEFPKDGVLAFQFSDKSELD